MAIIGIDLGTTNSLVSYWKDGEVHLLRGKDGSTMFASAVNIGSENIIIGNEAKELLYSDPQNTLVSFKRDMGTDKKYSINGKDYTPIALSAMVLKLLKETAQAQLMESVEEAVISVPAYFNDRQRSDTKKAAMMAGLKVERLINEPSAAALYYLVKQYNFDGNIDDLRLLVFDFGGGTLDLSYVECFENFVEIVAVAGDNHLGGDDIDKCIADYICKEKGREPSDALWKTICQEKCKLSAEHPMVIEDVVITEEELFDICMPLFQRIKSVVMKVLEDAQVRMSEVDDFILVGGSSNLSIVQKFLYELTGKEPFKPDSADEVVARGVGVYSGIKVREKRVQDIILTDVCPFSLGTDCVYNKDDKRTHLMPIIKRNSTLPCSAVKRFYTVSDYQREITTGIYQGENYYAEDNLLLGQLRINVTPRLAGKSYVDICFQYDINGILEVTATTEDGVKNKLLIKNQNLSDEEVLKYMEEMNRILPETSPWERNDVKILEQDLLNLYEEASESEKNQIGYLIRYFENQLSSGRISRIHKAINIVRKALDDYKQSSEIKELYLFDLKDAEDNMEDEYEEEDYEDDWEEDVDE